MPLELSTHGGKEVAEKLQKANSFIRHLEPLHKAAAIQLKGWVLRNFEADGQLHEESKYFWPPLSPITIAKRRQGGGTGEPKILRNHGILRGAFDIHQSNERGWIVNKTQYAKIHEEGGFSKEIEAMVPQRKMFPTVKQGYKIVLPAYKAMAAELTRMMK